MANFFHGVRTTKGQGSQSVNTAASGIVFAVGTAPVNQVDGYSPIVLANSFPEAQQQLGYSDDWEKFTLCEVMYSHFKVSAVGPVLLVNVADPNTHKETVEEAALTVANNQVTLPESATSRRFPAGKCPVLPR